jgi:hypothetical protein
MITAMVGCQFPVYGNNIKPDKQLVFCGLMAIRI